MWSSVCCQVNLDPALRTESPLDLKIKSGMLIDTLNIVGVPLPPASEPGAIAAPTVDVTETAADEDACSPDMARWLSANATAATATALSDAERWALHLVNSAFKRSEGGQWRRLFPSARSSEYYPFLDPERTMHRLPFEL